MRLTDDDRNFGPLTIGRTSWRPWRLVLSSGGDDDGFPYCHLVGYAFGWVFLLRLPQLVQPLRVKVQAGWDEATVARMGRDWYYNVYPREYGFSLNEGHLSLYYGVQNETGMRNDVPRKYWGWFVPWTQWRFIRTSYFTPDLSHFATEWEHERRGRLRAEKYTDPGEACPTESFDFLDYDGEPRVAVTRIEEREWRFGTGYFKWLSLFRRPKIRRSLDLRFDKEIGREKGSWKGGTVGHSIEMEHGDLPSSAFRRYCGMEHRSKSGKYRITYIGRHLVVDPVGFLGNNALAVTPHPDVST